MTSPKNLKEIELLYENHKGWYAFKKWGYAGAFFFKKFQAHYGEGIYEHCWVRPSPFYYGEKIIEYYNSKAELKRKLRENAKLRRQSEGL